MTFYDHNWRVFFYEGEDDEVQSFDCYADGEDHAIEQCIDAYPTAYITRCVHIPTNTNHD